MTISGKLQKTHYSESEAAQVLGVSVEELQQMVRRHIAAGGDDELPFLSQTYYQPSDLLLLRILAAQGPVAVES